MLTECNKKLVMVQEIVSYCIIGGAVGWVAFRSARFFMPSKGKKVNSGCGSCTAECALKNNLPGKSEQCADVKKMNLYL